MQMSRSSRSPKTTRQGVRDLNGPRMDGWDHNGRRPSCEHFRNPEVPTRVELDYLVVTPEGRMLETTAHLCVVCGVVRFYSED